MRVVQWLIAIAHVEVELSHLMPRKPPRLKCDGAAGERPKGSVSRCGHAAACCAVSSRPLHCDNTRRTWIHPLHSIGKSIGSIFVVDSDRAGFNSWVRVRRGSVGEDVVSSPARVRDDCVGRCERETGDDESELGKAEHDGV
jgi:hypothetical protein